MDALDASIQGIVGLLRRRHVFYRTPANNQVEAELAKISPRHVFEFAERVRRKIEYGIVARDTMDRLPASALVFTVDRSGFLRAEAIQRVQRLASPAALALLLIRLNDWVLEVRQAAIIKLDAIREAGLDSKTILACDQLLLDDRRFVRGGAKAAACRQRLLRHGTVPDSMKDLVLRGKSDDAPRYLKFILRTNAFDTWLKTIWRNAKHPRARTIAFRALMQRKVIWAGADGLRHRSVDHAEDMQALALEGLRDRSPEVRRAALDRIIADRMTWPDDTSLLTDLVQDRAISVSTRAHFALSQRGIDPIPALLAAFTATPRVATARGLGRFGAEAQGPLLFEASQRVSEPCRSQCLHAAVRLKHPGAIAEVKQICATGRSIDSRRAADTLRKAAEGFTFEELRAMVAQGSVLSERGLMPFVRNLRPMQIAQVLADLNANPRDPVLFSTLACLARKRNQGAFLASDAERNGLGHTLSDQPELRDALEARLGLSLPPPLLN